MQLQLLPELFAIELHNVSADVEKGTLKASLLKAPALCVYHCSVVGCRVNSQARMGSKTYFLLRDVIRSVESATCTVCPGTL